MQSQEVPEALITSREPLFVTLSKCPDGEDHRWGGGLVTLINYQHVEVSSDTCTRCGLPKYDYDFFVLEAP